MPNCSPEVFTSFLTSHLVKAARPFWIVHTEIALDLVAAQIFARRFAAIYQAKPDAVPLILFPSPMCH